MEHASNPGIYRPGLDETQERDKNLIAQHLSAAYTLARWILRNDAEAEDAVQEAYLRAFRHFDTYRGGNDKAWLLRIVRNSCYDRLRQSAGCTHVEYNEETPLFNRNTLNPESWLLQREQTTKVRRAVEALPSHTREILIFREFELMSYAQIAATVGIPIGTVMSRLSRAREQLRRGFLAAG